MEPVKPEFEKYEK
jgi:hypothetical protein